MLKEAISASSTVVLFSKHLQREMGQHRDDPDMNHPALKTLEVHSDPDSTWDSGARHAGRCYPGTRVKVLDEIQQVWQHETSLKRPILALMAPAGAGKSTIMQTLAERMARDTDSHPVVTFFLHSTPDGKENNSKRLAPTLALGMAKAFPDTRPYLIAAIERTPDIFGKPLGEQVEELIKKPMKRVLKEVPRIPGSDLGLIIILDGLDECDGKELANILNAILPLVAHPALHIRVAFSSRPEHDILEVLKDSFVCAKTVQIQLDETYLPSADIDLYVRGSLERIRAERMPDKPKEAWPLETDVAAIREVSSGHFIFASTALKYIDGHDPSRRLKEVLAWCAPTPRDDHVSGSQVRSDENPLQKLDSLYRSIIDRAANKLYPADINASRRLILFLSMVLGIQTTMVVEIKSMWVLEKFLKVDPGGIARRLEDLSSLVYMGSTAGYTAIEIRLYHKSFIDFLNDQSRCGDLFLVNPVMQELCILCTQHLLDPSRAILWSALVLNNGDCAVESYAFRFWGALLEAAAPFDEEMLQLLSELNLDTWKVVLNVLDTWEFFVFMQNVGNFLKRVLFNMLPNKAPLTDPRAITAFESFRYMMRDVTETCPTARDPDELGEQESEVQKHKWVKIDDEFSRGLVFPEGESEGLDLAAKWHSLEYTMNLMKEQSQRKPDRPLAQLGFILGHRYTGKTCLLRMACSYNNFDECLILLSATPNGRGITLSYFVQTAPATMTRSGEMRKRLHRRELCRFKDLKRLLQEHKSDLFQYFSGIMKAQRPDIERVPLLIFDDFHLLQDELQDEFIGYTAARLLEMQESWTTQGAFRIAISSRPTNIIIKQLWDINLPTAYYINLNTTHRATTTIEHLLYKRLVEHYPHPVDEGHPIPSPENLSHLAYLLTSTSRRWYHTSKLYHFTLIKNPSFWRDILDMDREAALRALDCLPAPSLPDWYTAYVRLHFSDKGRTIVPL